MVVGLVPATEGRVFLNDDDLTDLPMYRRARVGIGYLPQEASVFRKMSVEQNIRAIAETMPFNKAQREACVEQHLEELGLTHLAKQKAYTLSGGERRRLEISRALVTNPKFLLMDEPFSGVDPISVSEVQKIIVQLKERGIGVLITDHNVRETLAIVDRAYLLHEGAILAEGSSEFLIKDPKSREFYLGEDFNM
jgi:lipopolysaccharide export system ATP-binding protein